MSFSFPLDLAAPYPGLRPFLRDESVIFFGRDQQIDDVLARLKTHQFLGVVGTSGCGKSSFVRAGMLPALESGLMGELGSTWFVADMKPGDAPLTNFAKALIKSGVVGQRWSGTPEGIALLTAALRRSDVSLVNLVRQVQLRPYTNLLVLADQFEEIFRFRQQDPNEALAFVNLLLSTGRDRSVPIYVVLTIRTDFLGQCALFPGLPEALNDGQYLCPRLSRDQLAEAIEGPAAVFGATVEPLLVTQLLNDAGANSDHLPLVQHVMARIWHARPQSGRGPTPETSKIVLRLEAYQKLGGLNGYSNTPSVTQGATAGTGTSGGWYGVGPGYSSRQNALSRHADEAYLSLGDSQHESRVSGPEHNPSRKQLIAQMLFRCLAERGMSGAYVRRPMKLQDVADIAGCSVAELIEVVDVFRREDRSFLAPAKPKQDSLKNEESDLKPETMLDISHESLIRQWSTLRDQWLAAEEDSAQRYLRLMYAESRYGDLLPKNEAHDMHKWWQTQQPTSAWARRYQDRQSASQEKMLVTEDDETFRRVARFVELSWDNLQVMSRHEEFRQELQIRLEGEAVRLQERVRLVRKFLLFIVAAAAIAFGFGYLAGFLITSK